MNRSILLAAVLMASVALAGSERSLTEAVVGGSLVTTNESDVGYELERITFAIPQSLFSNTFSIAHVRTYVPPDATVSVVSTNEGMTPGNEGAVVTNVYRYKQAPVVFTNNYTLRGSTNTTDTQVYDLDDYGYDFTIEPGDLVTYTIAFTNAPVYMIRVICTHDRP